MSDEQTVTADDFKHLKGIGPATERHLHQAGILRYAQIAASTPPELAALVKGVAGMTAERIAQEDWIGQARRLAAETAPASGAGDAAPGNGQHYATFTVELLLDQDNQVRRTRVVHVQEKQKDTWAGWQSDRLIQFVTRQANLPQKPATTSAPTAVTPTPIHPNYPARAPGKAPGGLRLEPVDEQRMIFNRPKPQSVQGVKEQAVASPPQPPPSVQLSTTPVQLKSVRGVVEHGRSFDAQLILNLPEGQQAGDVPISYRATLYAANVSDGARQQVGDVQGAIDAAETVTIHVPGQISAPGTYRLEAEMALTWIPASPNLTSVVKGDLLHVY